MYKLKTTLLYMEDELFYIKTELINFRLTVPLAKLYIISARLGPNSLIFSDDSLVDIQLVTFLLLFKVSELNIRTKIKKDDNHHRM